MPERLEAFGKIVKKEEEFIKKIEVDSITPIPNLNDYTNDHIDKDVLLKS